MTELATQKKTKKARRPRVTITPEDFVKAWQTSSSAVEVNKKMGCVNSSSRAQYYRKKGIPLKKMAFGSRTHTRLDIPALVKLALELAPHTDNGKATKE